MTRRERRAIFRDEYGPTLFGFILSITMITIAVIGGLLAFAMVWHAVSGPESCANKWAESEWNFWGGCIVRYEGEYLPERVVEGILVKDYRLDIE